ncbi:hypothetical protein BDN70DRAFT_878082 [Pholiota conissans]|uniref:Transposase n=1 Tax=Pholiota conissans TaxID=109636 RepID=A0A9P5Z283_9AGAR|nr:hypothetical protein BDN70DRAFT_878082 [Pholiota conissans]
MSTNLRPSASDSEAPIVRNSQALYPCIYCGNLYKGQGIDNHQDRYCKHNPAHQQNILADEAMTRQVQDDINADRAAFQTAILGTTSESRTRPRSRTQAATRFNVQHDDINLNDVDNVQLERTHPSDPATIFDPASNTQVQETQLNSIRFVYHPAANQNSDIFTFDEYCDMPVSGMPDAEMHEGDSSLQNLPPWHPFPTRLDFDVAEVIEDARMNHEQTERMLSLLRQVQSNPDENEAYTIRNRRDLSKIWDLARGLRPTHFRKQLSTVAYKNETREFEVWYCPLWEWCRELLLDNAIVSEFTWNAVQLSKFDGQRYVQHIDEPWTAKAWWEMQTQLPAGSSPFCIILYADKTRLSSFGTEKGYPVLARCANLPVSMRNGEGVGGGRLIGWLPIPEEEALESGKLAFINLKRKIWHAAFTIIIDSIKHYAKTGARLRCGDNVDRNIYPRILIISADYEEMCMVSLIRGVNSKFPCPNCLVPKEEIPNLSIEYPLRTTEEMKRVWMEAQDMNSADKEEHLKGYGLRDVENTFWNFSGTDVYSAISWDRLHAYHAGMFSDHLFAELRRIVGELEGRDPEDLIDKALDAIPPWSRLNHFKSLHATGEFTDGTKHEDLSKVIIFASVHVLTEEASRPGYALLKLMRSYLELDMYASLTVHNETTIAAGKMELLTFEQCLKDYQNLTAEQPKTWTFPKAHTHQHMFRDIEYKGATRNYNTKPSERANGPLKKYYQRTNHRDVAPQILAFNERDVISTAIRTRIGRMDATSESSDGESDVEVVDDSEAGVDQNPPVVTVERIIHSSPQVDCTISDIALAFESDAAFRGFRGKLAVGLSHKLNIQRVVLHDTDIVTPYYSLKALFRSMVDWTINSNIVRAHPLFHHQPRYDYALVKVHGEEYIFAQVLYILRCTYRGVPHHMALILPFDVPRSPQNRVRDQDLRLTRVHPRRRSDSVFVTTNSIIRGALLVKDPQSLAAERFVIPFVDEDMSVRMRNITLPHHVQF